jgi:hypothetical protein
MIGVAGAMRARAASAEHVKTERRDYGRLWRIRRRVTRWGAVVGIAMAISLLGLVIMPRVVSWANPPEPPGYDPAMPVPAHAAVAPEQAVRDVTAARFEAIANADAEALRATTVAGSPARDEVEQMAAALESGALRVEGLAATIGEVRIVSATGRRIVAHVVYTVSPHVVRDAHGETASAGYAEGAELDLLWSDEGWQVERVRGLEGEG